MATESAVPLTEPSAIQPRTELRVLTPAGTRLPRFPRLAAIALGVGFVLAVVSEEASAVNGLAKVVGVLALFAIAHWAEQQAYRALLGVKPMGRLLATYAMPVLGLVGGIVSALAFGILGALAQDDGYLGGAFVAATMWLVSASVGTAAVVTIDVAISAIIRDFRSRVQLAVLALTTVAALGSIAIVFGGRWAGAEIVSAMRNGGDGVRVSGLDSAEVQRLLQLSETSDLVAAGLVMLSIVLALPAVLSACGKLADGVMERLNPLSEALDEVTDGRLDVRVEVGGSRDFVRIGEGFNRMVGSLATTLSSLGERNRELVATNQATSRFVPFQFLELLEKRSIVDIARGDQIQLDISVLFSDIRGFTTMAEAMGVEETFAFINRYLAQMEPEIHRENGFINEFLGDGVMALFHTGADDAVRAGIGMLRALERLNAELSAEGRAPIEIGIGMNSGPLMLGTIGGRDRLACTVIGDPANAAARVEGMTKLYGARFLVSDRTVERLTDPAAFRLREIDRVQAVGKREAMRIFEVLDGEPAARREGKASTLTDFAEGIEWYRAGDFDAARRCFARCVEAVPDDRAAALYLARCGELARGAPADWDGITRLDTK